MFDLSQLHSGLDSHFKPARQQPADALYQPSAKNEAEKTANEQSAALRKLPLTKHQLDFSHKQSLQLELRTQEGDQIKLSFSALDAHSQTLKPGQFQQTSISANQLQISIKGNLSEGELADLSAFLEQVETLAGEFYGGDLAGAFSLAQEFDISGTELASFSLNLHTETQLRQVQEYRAVEGKPKLAPSLMEQMGGYLEQLRSTAELAEKISPAQQLLEPVLDWLDQGDNLFNTLNKQYLQELLPDIRFNPRPQEQ